MSYIWAQRWSTIYESTKIKLNDHDYSWLVLDNNYLPVKPITDFIRYLIM